MLTEKDQHQPHRILIANFENAGTFWMFLALCRTTNVARPASPIDMEVASAPVGRRGCGRISNARPANCFLKRATSQIDELEPSRQDSPAGLSLQACQQQMLRSARFPRRLSLSPGETRLAGKRRKPRPVLICIEPETLAGTYFIHQF